MLILCQLFLEMMRFNSLECIPSKGRFFFFPFEIQESELTFQNRCLLYRERKDSNGSLQSLLTPIFSMVLN